MSSRRRAFVAALVVFASGVLLLSLTLRLNRRAAPLASRQLLIYDVPDVLEEDEPEALMFSPSSWRRPRITLFELLETLHAAEADPRVRGVVLHIGDIEWGWAKIGEVHNALLALRAAKKPVEVLLEGGGEPELFLASAASRIAMPPASELRLDGLAASALFLRGTFDKIGVKPNFYHVGKYKSAVESYTRTGFSDASREALTSLLEDAHRPLAETLAVARRVSPDTVMAWMDRGPYAADVAKTMGLIDTLLDQAELDTLAVRRAGRGATTIKLTRYFEGRREERAASKIALVAATGTIVFGRSRVTATGERLLGSETLIEALRQARARTSVRAIVLRIDSPGGDAAASDAIWREVMRCRRSKPVIASMSDLAASGGYYIASAADTIVAMPGTITGSIGIYGGKFNISGLYEKLGIRVESVTTGPRAQMYSAFRDFTADEERAFTDQLQRGYERFLERVATGRGRETAWVDSVGQGRVWSGLRAAELGLVDRLGGLDESIRLARLRAGIPKDERVSIERLPEVEEGFLRRFVRDFFETPEGSGDARAAAMAAPLRVLERAALFGSGAAMALLPFDVVIR